jgi:Fur family transcriptional regulator, ferric uptake regulator
MMKVTSRSIAGKLRHEGYRLTPQRRAVVEALTGREDLQTIGAIYESVRAKYPDIGLATVYRVVNLLVELRLVCSFSIGDSQSYVIRRPAGHHHHLICLGCGKSVDFTGCNLEGLEARLGRETGFEISEHFLEIYGYCPECRANRKRTGESR